MDKGFVVDTIEHEVIPGMFIILRGHRVNFARDQAQEVLFEHGFLEAEIEYYGDVRWVVLIAQYATNAAPTVQGPANPVIMLYPFETLEGIGVNHLFGELKFWATCKDLRNGRTYPRMITLPE